MEYSTPPASVKDWSRSPPEAVAALLRRLRREAGLRQRDLAVRLGRSQSYVSKYENCRLGLDIGDLLAICEGLGVTFAAFASLLEAEIRA